MAGISRVETVDSINARMKSLQDLYNYEEELAISFAQYEYELTEKKVNKEKKVIEAGYVARRNFEKQFFSEQKKLFDKQQADRLKAIAETKDEKTKKELQDQYDADFQAFVETEKKKKQYQDDAEKAEANAKKKEKDKQKKDALKEAKEKQKELSDSLFGKGKSFGERKDALKEMFTATDEDGNKISGAKGVAQGAIAGLTNLTNALGDYIKQLDSQIDSIGKRQSTIDTRLQGSKNARKSGSYWSQMTNDLMGIAAVSPLVRQEDIATHVETMVTKGIAYNVEQRAFLDTIKTKIADTFEATNGTLLRLVRIQQQDTTAARLGMESALTSFLNNMYETTEYMTDVASSIKSSLEEAEALMGTKSAAAFEYQVQKWMGSLYSVGMSQNATSNIANILGQIAAGNISSLNGQGAGNLIIMAANNAGLSISDILQNGLTDTTTNDLMYAMVDYLAGIYDETKGSKVVQQQYAQVFGLTASDLKAIANLNQTTRKNIAKNGLNYEGMISQLYSMAGSMGSRTSTGEMLNNLFDNLKYTMSAGIASNPALYGIYKIANMLTDLVGGVDIPLPMLMGTGLPVALNVSDLMRVGAMSASILGSMGTLIGGLGNSFSGQNMLSALGIGSGLTTVQRGTGIGLAGASAMSVSEKGFIGNSESGDVYNKTVGDATADANNQVKASAEENEEATMTDVNNNVLAIYQLLQDVVNGTSMIHTVTGGFDISLLK